MSFFKNRISTHQGKLLVQQLRAAANAGVLPRTDAGRISRSLVGEAYANAMWQACADARAAKAKNRGK